MQDKRKFEMTFKIKQLRKKQNKDGSIDSEDEVKAGIYDEGKGYLKI